jgi:hypothetical protein
VRIDAASAPFIRGIAKSNTIKSGFNLFAIFDGLHSVGAFTAHFKSGVFQENPNNISNKVTIIYH